MFWILSFWSMQFLLVMVFDHSVVIRYTVFLSPISQIFLEGNIVTPSMNTNIIFGNDYFWTSMEYQQLRMTTRAVYL